jgi:osmotically inducible protein OsmC
MGDRRATVTWEGGLVEGHGSITSGSGALQDAPVTWASRVERSDGKTSPEELLAAAHAECYAMVLTNLLGQQDKSAESLEVSAVCTVKQEGSGLKIATMALHVKGRVTGMDQESFTRLAAEGDRNCPVSNALRGNVKITVDAELQSDLDAGLLARS